MRDLLVLPCLRMSIVILLLNLIREVHFLLFIKQYTVGKVCSTMLSCPYFINNSMNYVLHCQGQKWGEWVKCVFGVDRVSDAESWFGLQHHDWVFMPTLKTFMGHDKS